MKVKVWGVRGSIPTPGETTLRYGGNTPCIQVEVPAKPGEPPLYLILDAGSGVRLLGNQLTNAVPCDSPLEIHLFLTHIHWDHIQGIPFFKPLYRKDTRIRLYGPDFDNFEKFLRHQMYPNYFPISMDHADVKAKIEFLPLDLLPAKIGPVLVRHHYVNHGAAGTVTGYRVEMEGASFVYIPDVEPYDYPVEKSQAKINENHELERALIDFVRDADVMLFDTTYTAEEYERLKGWGHSPMDYALEVAAKARVRRLGLFHYDPMREDSDIDKMVETLQTQGRRIGVDVFGSQEGMVLDIGGRESAGGKHS